MSTSTTTATQTMGRLVVPAMILAVSMSYIDQTIVAIASPDLQSGLHLTSSQGQWVINAYTVALAAVFALGGKLADTLGRRRMVLIGVIGFTTSSVLCGLTPAGAYADTWMIAARVLQGTFAALLMPAAITTVYASAPIARRGRTMATFFGVSGAFIALGPILGSYLLNWSWRLIFFVNLPVGIAAVICILAANIPDNRTPGRIDWRGAVLVAAGMSASVIGFAQSSTWGWTSVWTWACLAAGVALLAVFVLVELRTAEPLVDLRIFRSRGFRIDAGVLFFSMMAFVPLSYFLSVYAHVSLGEGPSGANSLLLTFFFGFFAAAQFGGRLFDSRGAKTSLLLGCALSAAGFAYWGMHVTDLSSSLSDQWPLFLAGAGIGFVLGPTSADAVSRADESAYGEVTGANQTVRNYGSALGFAILGTLLTHSFTARFTDSLVSLGVPQGSAHGIAAKATSSTTGGMSGVPASMRVAVDHAVAHDFALGMRTVAFAMAAALAVAFLVALRHPVTARRAPRPRSTPSGRPSRSPRGDRTDAMLTMFLASLGALFPVTNPVFVIAAYASLTEGYPVGEARRQAVRTGVYVFLILGTFALVGVLVLEAFGITLGALQVAGGMVVAYAGFGMLSSRDDYSEAERADARARQEARRDISFAPMALPLIAGPGAIGVMIALGARSPDGMDHLGILAAVAVIAVGLALCMSYATPLVKRMGPVAIAALVKVMGFLILAVGVELVTHGIYALYGR